jgi:predicted PP-loop superfamily ATPase
MPGPERSRLFYVDERLESAEVDEALRLAWDEICLIEYDYLYQGFRGVHMDEKGTTIFVTFQLGSGGLDNAAMAIINRETKDVDFAQAPLHMLKKEIKNLEKALDVDFSELESEDLADRTRDVEDPSD